ncbi:MAG: SiaB family protein kinase [Raineya sp.]|nr:SiaB family protein kinase [Raineya sp.]MDW8295897.1 SiaB family protein kinase [Raineya sp.]
MQYFMEHLANETLFFYKGIFSYPVIVEISHHIRNDLNLDEKTREKLFAIFVELAQNVSSYSQERVQATIINREVGIGAFYIIEQKNIVKITTLNKVSDEQMKRLLTRVSKINALDRTGLRTLKMNFRNEAIQKHTLSGNVGLIEVALKSANPIVLDTVHFQNNKYVMITAQINKK